MVCTSIPYLPEINRLIGFNLSTIRVMWFLKFEWKFESSQCLVCNVNAGFRPHRTARVTRRSPAGSAIQPHPGAAGWAPIALIHPVANEGKVECHVAFLSWQQGLMGHASLFVDPIALRFIIIKIYFLRSSW